MDDLKNRTLTIERKLSAPVRLVWEAWSQSEHIATWWAPKGMETKVIKHEFKVGGEWKYSMMMPDGNEFISEGQYTDIVELERIITSADFKPMTEGVELQALFVDNGDTTKFTFKVVHPTEDYCRQQEKMGFMNGWGSVFDRLEIHVSESSK